MFWQKYVRALEISFYWCESVSHCILKKTFEIDINYEIIAFVQACFIGLKVEIWLNEAAICETENETVLAAYSPCVAAVYKCGDIKYQ